MATPEPPRELDGILLVDKPEGISSARAVAIVKRTLGGARTGHLGTLDPFASGLLPLCVGEGTKAARYLNLAGKSYTGSVRLGVTSDTLDRTGELSEQSEVPTINREQLDELEDRFRGTFEQVPPAFSAIKTKGVASYKRARAGDAVEPPPRSVTIERISIQLRTPKLLAIEVDCSKGTYIRSLARDIGAALGCGALLESLIRTRFEPFVLEDAVKLKTEGADAEELRNGLLSVEECLAWMPSVSIDAATETDLRCGRQAVLRSLDPDQNDGGPVRLMRDSALVAVASLSGSHYKLDRIFN